ncbi:MAG: Cna B-type domain-containing protein, partial [Butyrivibrio sp.]|nr:Cna B-type domain-containing protein [Butyrivibrio sp.]
YEETSDSDILDRYIKANKINPVTEGVSDDKGKTYYTGLKLGVYYVHSDKIVKDEYTHSFVNFVYPVPILVQDKATGVISPNYSPEAEPKKSRVKNDVETHCSIQKQWNDGGYANRPASVVFEIYCDGELMETVTLSSSNNWYHEWQNLGAHDYTVREVGIADGYSSSISVYQKPGTHDFVYTCVNSRGGGDNPPPPPDNPPPDNPPPDNPPPNTPPSNPPGVPDIPAVLGAIRQLPQVLGARRLPQTGQLWWPLPILVIAGIFFIVKGIKKNAKMKAKNN